MADNSERLRELCQQVSQEQYGDKLTELVQQLNEELLRLSGKKAPASTQAEPNTSPRASHG
jgi:hypothetical protein